MIATAASLNLSRRLGASVVLGFVTIELICLALGRVTGVGPILAVIPAVVALTLAAAFASPVLGCALLIVSCFIDRPEIPVGAVHMRVPELAALGLTGAALSTLLRSNGSLRQVLRVLVSIPLFWPIAAFLATNYLSILFSPEKVRSIELNLIYTILALGYFAFVTMRISSRDLHKLAVVLYLAAVFEAVGGLALLWVGSARHDVMYGIQFDPTNHYFMAMGTLQDANYFGSFLITPFLVGVSLAVLQLSSPKGRARIGWTVAGLALLVTAIATSLTRGAWLGLASAMVIYFAVLISKIARLTRFRVAAVAGLAVAAAVTGLLVANAANFGAAGLTGHNAQTGRVPGESASTSLGSVDQPVGGSSLPATNSTSPAESGAGSVITARVKAVFDLTKGSTQGRLYTAGLALNEWRKNPVFGVGTASFHGAATGQEHPWILNMFITALHDTGVVGLLVMIWLVATYLLHLWSAVGRQNQSDVGLFTLSLLAGSAGLFVAFQASTGMILMYPWMLIALGMTLAMQSRDGTPQSAPRDSQAVRAYSSV